MLSHCYPIVACCPYYVDPILSPGSLRVEKLCCSVAGLQSAVGARAKKTLCCSITGLRIVVVDEICEGKMLGDSVPGLQDAMPFVRILDL